VEKNRKLRRNFQKYNVEESDDYAEISKIINKVVPLVTTENFSSL